MVFVEPVVLEVRGVRLLPLRMEHEAGGCQQRAVVEAARNVGT